MCLKEGIINFLINQKPEIQGYLGVEYLYKKIVLKDNIFGQIIYKRMI